MNLENEYAEISGKFAELSDEIRASQDQWTSLRVRDLRELFGAQRMSNRLASRIEALLSTHGLYHLPAHIPTSQDTLVVLYTDDSPIASAARQAS